MTDTPEYFKTPFIKTESGWKLQSCGQDVEYGFRFDAGIGYRVYYKFTEATMLNAFPASTARAIMDGLDLFDDLHRSHQLDALMKASRRLIEKVETLNAAWSELGCPDRAMMDINTKAMGIA